MAIEVMSRFTSTCSMLSGCGRRFHSTVANNVEQARYDIEGKPAAMSLDEWGALTIEACPECVGAEDILTVLYVGGGRYCEICGQPRHNGERTERGTFDTVSGGRVDGCRHTIAGGVLNGYVVPRSAFITH